MTTREEQLEKCLKTIIEDFDQTGCDSNLGVIRTCVLNRARRLLDMDPLEDASEEIPEEFENFPGAWTALCAFVEKEFKQALIDNACDPDEFIVDSLQPQIVNDGSDHLWFEVDYNHYYWNADNGRWYCEEDEDDD